MNNIFINKNIERCLKSQLKKFDFTEEDYKKLKNVNLCAFNYGNNFISNSLEDLKKFPNIINLNLSNYILNRPNIKVIEELLKIDTFMFYECDFKDYINIGGNYIEICNCKNIAYINFNNFEEIKIENCEISNIKFDICKKIELGYVELNKEKVDYINSLTNNITLINCKYDEKFKFNSNITIINNKNYMGGI